MTRAVGARTRNAVAASAVLLLTLGSATDALGATITVTTQADTTAADGACSLREVGPPDLASRVRGHQT